jgi:hypothetical protein
MGGSGGGGYIPRGLTDLRGKIQQARDEERNRLAGEVDAYLRDVLARFNERDAEETRARLGDVHEILGEDTDVETLLFGGSIAKHTYVDGLSDVDALVILDRDDLRGLSPDQVLEKFHEVLTEALTRRDVESIAKGSVAITIRFRDGGELQLLPAVRKGTEVAIADAVGKGWREINPAKFREALSRENERLGHALVPTIKLVKSLMSDLPKQQQLSGYHVEALALDAARTFRGAKTPSALLRHVLDHAAARVLTPIRDVTGQSRAVDDYLGEARGARRKLVAQALSGVRRRLEAATTLRQWRAMFGEGKE